MPGMRLIRPADANETAHALRIAVDSEGPTLLILSRQDLPVLDGTADRYGDVARGAYVLRDTADAAITLVGTGSEVWVCLDAADAARRRRRRGTRRQHAVVGAVRRAVRRLPQRGARRLRVRSSRSRPARASGGSGGPTTPSASTASVRQVRVTKCWPCSGSRRPTSPRRATALIEEWA